SRNGTIGKAHSRRGGRRQDPEGAGRTSRQRQARAGARGQVRTLHQAWFDQRHPAEIGEARRRDAGRGARPRRRKRSKNGQRQEKGPGEKGGSQKRTGGKEARRQEEGARKKDFHRKEVDGEES